MAFDLGLLENTTGPNGADANVHTLHLLCDGSINDAQDFLIIDRLWINNYNDYLDTPGGNGELPGGGVPHMKFFPYFLLPHETSLVGQALEYNETYPDDYPVPYSFNVANGAIIHPLSNFGVGQGLVYWSPTTMPGWYGVIRDNYRLKKRVKIRNMHFTNDVLIIKVMFSTYLTANFTGDLSVDYRVFDFSNNVLIPKHRVIPFNGITKTTNVSEVDYTLFGDIHELDEVEVSSPFISIELS